METLDKLKAKRKIIRTACTKLINKAYLLLESCDIESERDQEQLSEHLSSLEAKQLDLKSLNSEIEDLISDSALFDIEIQSSFEYEEQINEAKFKIKSKIKKFKTDQQPIPPLAANGSNVRINCPATSINLPKLRIPTFSGDASTFLEFINSFNNAIDSNDSLSNVDKFIYLKSFLSGEAYKIVSGFSLTEENYKSCLSLLKDRYGKQDHLISHFMNRLLETEPVKSSFNLKGLRKLHDESEISIRNLNSMGIASGNYGHLPIPILLKQLPQDLVIEFHRRRDSYKIGDVNELIKFIKFEIESRESANIATGHSQKVPEIPRYPSRNSVYHGHTKFKNKLPSSAALNTVVKNVCAFCNSDTHTALKCKNLSDGQKRYKLKKEGRCYRCMAHRHIISQCKAKIPPCETCQSFQHNSLFCPKNKIESSSFETETHGQEVVISSVLKAEENPGSYATLLQTANVQAENGANKIMARLLFDSGSQKSFLRSDLEQALNLKSIRQEKLLVYTFSNREPIEKIFDVVRFRIRSKFPPYQFLNIEALASEEITGSDVYSNVDLKHVNKVIPATCNLSDSLENSTPIQILLGADFLCNVLRGEARKINKNLFLQPTLFGDTLIGQIPDLQKRKHSSVFTVSCAVVETDLKRLWELDSFLIDGTSENKSRDNLGDFGKELKIKNGRYEAPLQWKTNEIKEKLSNNFDVAEKRFIALEKKFNKDQALFERYNAVMQEQVNEGIIQMCHDECFTGYVMPHREVFRETSSSTKTRIRFLNESVDTSSVSGGLLITSPIIK
ncbi:uncharacterized protein LOC129987626 [Argiope bruennichi]|uniref:uncharacterized protein LOC129987626 n=1 Tax=Argiope bruennichi TaxID=94029 RepID=UPI002494DD73|nr:uncharacterized protein LOC129987626 [Argiope bruennichi]